MHCTVHAHPAASCPVIKDTSITFGDGGCGSSFDDTSRDPALRIREVQVWYSSDCVRAIKTVLTGEGGAGKQENVYGQADGSSSQTLKLEANEVINGVDVQVGK